MKFRTECKIENDGLRLDPRKPVVAAGSCFAQNIISKMRSCLWNASNPLGVLFNPLSIEKAIRLAILSKENEDEFANTLFRDKDWFHSWSFDSSFSSQCEKDSIKKFRLHTDEFRKNLKEGQTLIITFGTAYCYFLKEKKDEVVANCHKMPSTFFERRRISIEEITGRWSNLLNELKQVMPDLQVIFTVSPVRHLRDGLHENNLSKSILHLSIDNLCRTFDFCHYFPAFELVNDDLRDYRFYADDMTHPSESAIEYIWENFRKSLLDESGNDFLKRGEAIWRRASHRPILATDDEIQKFKEETIRQYNEFIKTYPSALKEILR